MTRRKSFRIGAAVVTLLLLAAMSAFATAQAETAKDEGEYFVGFAQDTLNQPWRNYQAVSVETALKEYGVEYVITDGQGRAERQISNI